MQTRPGSQAGSGLLRTTQGGRALPTTHYDWDETVEWAFWAAGTLRSPPSDLGLPPTPRALRLLNAVNLGPDGVGA